MGDPSEPPAAREEAGRDLSSSPADQQEVLLPGSPASRATSKKTVHSSSYVIIGLLALIVVMTASMVGLSFMARWRDHQDRKQKSGEIRREDPPARR